MKMIIKWKKFKIYLSELKNKMINFVKYAWYRINMMKILMSELKILVLVEEIQNTFIKNA